jgi:hypothetical protein
MKDSDLAAAEPCQHTANVTQTQRLDEQAMLYCIVGLQFEADASLWSDRACPTHDPHTERPQANFNAR